MINFGACPRCRGPVFDSEEPNEDSPMCITCGWRDQGLSPEILAEVEACVGKAYTYATRYLRKTIGTGQPALSGWDKIKRRRALAQRRELEVSRSA